MNKRFSIGLIFVTIICLVNNTTSFSQKISTYAGGGVSLADNIIATSSNLGYFGGFATDTSGTLFIAVANSNKIKKVDRATEIITTVAGTGSAAFSGDNGLAGLAELNNPIAIAFDRNNNLYIVDAGNNRVRKVDAITGIITTIAGSGINLGDGGPATSANLNAPQGIAIDTTGTLYVSDVGNERVRKIDINGIISTVAGNGIQGFGGDNGPASMAQLDWPLGLCIDSAQNLFIADWNNKRIRKIDFFTGIITTVAGIGLGTYNGDNIQATAAYVDAFGLTFDDSGNLFVADRGDNRIRKIDLNGNIYTVVATGVSGFSGDGGMADTAKIDHPQNVIFDNCGNLFIADDFNKRVRKVTYDSTCTIGAPLAIQLLSFTGNAAVTGNMLYWEKSNEQSITKFELQRSEDGKTFDKIAAVSVKNNSTSYSYTDETAQNTCYYRLKILETSGAYSYSDVVAIRRNNISGAISLYPNPVKEQLTVTGGNDIVVTNALGQLVMNVKCDNYQTNIDVSGLKSGLYYVTVQDANGAISRLKFVKE